MKNSIIALRRTVDLIPDASNAWARLGDLLLKQSDNSDEAKKAFETALLFDDEQITALENLSSIYANENNSAQDEDEISVLEKIENLSSLSKSQINRFGILNYRNHRIHEAIRCWKMNVWQADHPSQRYNLGLAYNHDTISQRLDAIDMWLLVLYKWSDYEPAKKCISSMQSTLLDLATRARTQAETILPKDLWFNNYINPFELLNIPSDITYIDNIDTKLIQRLKKKLLQEIELEDGNLQWMPSVVIDKSLALKVCDELNDEKKMEWHWLVFSNKPLLNFLTKGTHEHFLLREVGSGGLEELLLQAGLLGDVQFSLKCGVEAEILSRIEKDNDFLEWLSKFFALQFDRVLTKAIDQGNVIIIECLLNGRRWVSMSMVDECFRNARHSIEKLINPLNELWEHADKVKPSVGEIEHILECNHLLEILNLLPVFFEKYQSDAISSIRGLAIKAFNIHNDIGLSQQIIHLTYRFKFRSKDLIRSIEEDQRTIDEIILEERKHEVKLTIREQACEITKEGIRQGDIFIEHLNIFSVSWGAIISSDRWNKTCDFSIEFSSDDGRRINFQWKVSENRIEEQQRFFNEMIDATYNYVLPALLPKIEKIISDGSSINIGPCIVASQGVSFDVKGWFFTDQHFIPWNRVRISTENGTVYVFDETQPKKRTSFIQRNTDNAPILRILANIKNEKDK